MGFKHGLDLRPEGWGEDYFCQVLKPKTPCKRYKRKDVKLWHYEYALLDPSKYWN